MEEIAVSFFNAAGHTTVAGGTVHPKGTIILSSNKSFVENDRNASRMVHVPFFKPNRIQVTELENECEIEEQMRQARNTASSSIGEMISMGDRFNRGSVQKHIDLTSTHMPTMSHRTQKSYATVLAFASQLTESVGDDTIVNDDELIEFVKDTWLPEVMKLYHPSSNIVSEYLSGLLLNIRHLKVNEVLRFMRPNVRREGGTLVVAIHQFSGCLLLFVYPNEHVAKEHIKKVGMMNVSLDFLRDTSSDTTVRPRSNGKKKCIMIPHRPCIPEEILQGLYEVAGVMPIDVREEEERRQLIEEKKREEERRQFIEEEERRQLIEEEKREEDERRQLIEEEDEERRQLIEEEKREEDERRQLIEEEEEERRQLIEEEKREEDERRRLIEEEDEERRQLIEEEKREEDERRQLIEEEEEERRQLIEEKREEDERRQLIEEEKKREEEKKQLIEEEKKREEEKKQLIEEEKKREEEKKQLIEEEKKREKERKQIQKEKNVRKAGQTRRRCERNMRGQMRQEERQDTMQPQVNKDVCPPMTCKLQKKKGPKTFVNCDECLQWYHVNCVGLTAAEAKKMDTWKCQLCI